MNNYFDMLMTNHKLVSNSSDEQLPNLEHVIIKQNGGDPKKSSDKYKNISTGSFPPLYLMTAEEKEKEEQNKARTFSAPTNKTALSIKEIMQERRDDKKPFISF